MFWSIDSNSILDLEAYGAFPYGPPECGDWTSEPEETYKWLCHKRECGTINTSKIEERMPLCSGEGCDHRKCGNCTNLKNEGHCLLLGMDTTSEIVVPTPAGTIWYCCKCGQYVNGRNPRCSTCFHQKCAYCANGSSHLRVEDVFHLKCC